MNLSLLKKNNLDVEKVCWRITRKCNLNCLFCLAGYRNKFYEDMPLTKALETIDMLSSAGTKALSFSGGEPLLREDFDIILRASSDRGIRNTVTTNGTLITPYWVNVLKNYAAKVKVSLDGPKDIHNKLRNSKTFDITFNAVKQLLVNDVCVEINHLLTSLNIQQIKEFCELFKDLSISKMNLIIPMNRENMIHNKHLLISEKQLDIVRKNIADITKEYNINLDVKNYSGDSYKRLFLEADGTILEPKFCSKNDVIIGNVFDFRKRDIYACSAA